MSPLDEISLVGLRIFGRHGVYADERRDGQEFVVDVTMSVDTHTAARTDDVADTVHYGEVAEAVARVVGGEPVDLLESLAQRIADVVLAFPRVAEAAVTVHKPQAPVTVPFSDVTVSIRRVSGQAGGHG